MGALRGKGGDKGEDRGSWHPTQPQRDPKQDRAFIPLLVPRAHPLPAGTSRHLGLAGERCHRASPPRA